MAFQAGFFSLGSSAVWGQLILYAGGGRGGEGVLHAGVVGALFCAAAGVIATLGCEGAGLCSSYSTA